MNVLAERGVHAQDGKVVWGDHLRVDLLSISGGAGEPEQIDAEVVSPDYFSVLRVNPAFGRTFTQQEDGAAGDAPVAILSDRLWRQRYTADPAIVGKTVRVNDVALTVVGVMRPGFSGLSNKSTIWIPRTMAPRLTYAEYLTTPQLFIAVIARLKAGVTIDQANAELSAASAAFRFDRTAKARSGARWRRRSDRPASSRHCDVP